MFFLFLSFMICYESQELPIQIVFHLHIIMSLILQYPYIKIATVKTSGSFVPFTLHLKDNHHVKVSVDLFSLRFNLRIGSKYVG